MTCLFWLLQTILMTILILPDYLLNSNVDPLFQPQNNHTDIDIIPDFDTQAINYYFIHQYLCFANVAPGKPMILTLQTIARHLEITWFINHPKTPPTFIHCLQTVFENERLMVAVRLEAIRRQVGIHIIATDRARLIGNCWEPHRILSTVPSIMDLTGIMYLHRDISVTACVQMPPTTERINTFPRDHTQLLNTPLFAFEFAALVASNPICYQALCCYSDRRPCTYTEALYTLARQSEILWYNNHSKFLALLPSNRREH